MAALSGPARAAITGYCVSGTTQWNGGNGGWGDGDWSTGSGNWSNGYPSNACDTVIDGNVTVTFTTISDHYGNEDNANVKGLTLSGGATLVVRGESDDVQGNWYNATTVNVGADGLEIEQGSTLDLEASSDTAPVQGTPPGGSANVTVDSSVSGGTGNATLTNNGSIVASTNDSTWGESLNVGGTLANDGSITVQSGQLTLQGQNYPYVLNDSGTFTVDSGASATMIAGDGSVFTNTGSVANQGTFTLQQSMHWAQNAGSTSGNPVQLTGGETLEDSAGSGSFEIDNCSTGGVMGTIPAGQTVTVMGGCAGTTLWDGGTGTAPLTNRGTIDLSAAEGAGDGIIAGSELDNYGTINATVGSSSLNDQLLVPLVNEAGGIVDLSGGELAQTAGSATSNAGTVNIGPGATWLVQTGSFTNSGTLAPQIAGATSVGTVNLTVGSRFNAGGTLAPTLVSGYTPAASTEFPIVTMNGGSPSGTFAAVTGGFSADYGKETAGSNSYLGVIYGAAASTGGGGASGGGGTGAARQAVEKLSGGAGKMMVKLTCARSARSACAYSVTGTAGKTRVASGHGTVKAGKTVTVTLELNRTGTALLRKHHRLRVKLLVSAGGRTLESATVTVTRAVRTKRK